MCVRSKDQFPSLHCRKHGLEVTFSWCPGNWPLVALECDISRWTEEPLLFSLTKCYHKKLRYIKIFVLKPVVGRRLCYKAKLGLQFSVAWMNVRPLMFLPNFLLSVPQRVAVAMLAVFSHLGLPCGCSSLEVSWWALMAVNSGLLCCKWRRMLRLIQITRKPAVGCSCNSAEELIWDYAVIGGGELYLLFLTGASTSVQPVLYWIFFFVFGESCSNKISSVYVGVLKHRQSHVEELLILESKHSVNSKLSFHNIMQ